jgi:hypothetical protein
MDIRNLPLIDRGAAKVFYGRVNRFPAYLWRS